MLMTHKIISQSLVLEPWRCVRCTWDRGPFLFKKKKWNANINYELRICSLQVIHSARANATHNHGLDLDRLLVGKWCKWSFAVPFILASLFCALSFYTAEAFVGKGFYRKRVSYHAKGKCGVKERPECRLTVVVREMTAEEEAEIARLRVHNFRKLTKRERRLVPHKLIETTSIWNRKGKGKVNSHESSMAAWTSFTSMCHNVTESSVEVLRDLYLFVHFSRNSVVEVLEQPFCR